MSREPTVWENGGEEEMGFISFFHFLTLNRANKASRAHGGPFSHATPSLQRLR
jgi:hypothetical protein